MHVYLIELPPAPLPSELHERLASELTETSREAVKRFRLPEDVLRSLVGRLAPIWYLRTKHLIEANESPVFGKRNRGKPTIAEPDLQPPTDFNTSHDGSYVLLGVARGAGCEIGVDLMKLPDNPVDIQEGISEQLSHDERHSLAVPLSPHERSKRITTLWTHKECYVKATGDGVGFGMERITLTLGPNGEVDGVCVDDNDVRWDGWKYASGFQKRHLSSSPGHNQSEAEEYGWTIFWRGDDTAWDRKLEVVDWDTFLLAFRDTSA